MTEQIKYRVRRDSVELGCWDKFEVREFIARGSLMLSDETYLEDLEKWVSLIPAYRRGWNLFDWKDDDDQLWFYIRDGYIHGPRLLAEVNALYESGFLPGDVLITSIESKDWASIADLLADSDSDNLEVTAKAHANEALEKFLEGDKIGAGVSGVMALGKAWKNFTKPELITSEWLCVAIDTPESPPTSAISNAISDAGFVILDYEDCMQGESKMLALKFDSVDEATQVRDALQHTAIGDKWLFEFCNRHLEPTSEYEGGGRP